MNKIITINILYSNVCEIRTNLANIMCTSATHIILLMLPRIMFNFIMCLSFLSAFPLFVLHCTILVCLDPCLFV